MFASLPFILLLILQGFARQDGAELFVGSRDLASVPVQARHLKSFDELFSLSFSIQEKQGVRVQIRESEAGSNPESTSINNPVGRRVEKGYLEIQRSRDGPTA